MNSTPRREYGSLVVLVSLAVGTFTGVSLTWLWQARQPVPTEAVPTTPAVVRDYTDEELQVVCLPHMRRTATTLEEVQTKVSALELRIRDKEVEIDRLEREMGASSSSSSTLTQRLQVARDQLGELEVELLTALHDKGALLTELATAREALAGTRMALAASEARVIEAREEALEQRWTAFLQDAQLTVCEGGNAGRLAVCRGVVATGLQPHRARFKDCIRGGQASPELRRTLRRDEVPQDYAFWLDEDDRITRGWYVLFCDPALPEARRDVERTSDTPPPFGP